MNTWLGKAKLALALYFAIAGLLLLTIGCSQPAATNTPTQTAIADLSPASKWNGKLIRQPGRSPEDGKVYVVQNGTKQWIINGQWILQHGYKWPDDVHVISASDLNAIPTGEPIQ